LESLLGGGDLAFQLGVFDGLEDAGEGGAGLVAGGDQVVIRRKRLGVLVRMRVASSERGWCAATWRMSLKAPLR
jgi:hypothetical protein